MKKIVVLTLLIASIIAACTAPVEEPTVCCRALTASCLACSEGVSVEAYCADNPETVGCTAAEPEPEPPVPSQPEVTMDEATAALQVKASKSTNYRFTRAELPENRATDKYSVRGNIVRVDLFKSLIREEDSYDAIYLDLQNEKAVAYCHSENRVICPNPEELVARVDFADYHIELPHELMGRLDNGVRTGSQTYDEAVSEVIQAEIDGVDSRILVHKFYGVPLKLEQGEAGYALRDVSFNSVTEDYVTPPSGW